MTRVGTHSDEFIASVKAKIELFYKDNYTTCTSIEMETNRCLLELQ